MPNLPSNLSKSNFPSMSRELPSGGFDDVGVHASLVLDAVRVDAYARAIKKIVKRGDVVVDVGTGSGILAVLAARCGARKVYALEHGPMAALLPATIAENGCKKIIEVFHGDARDAEFKHRPNVIVSETLGSLGIDEDGVGLLTAVRARCQPQCTIIPSRLDIILALVQDAPLKRRLAGLEDIRGVHLHGLRTRCASQPFVDRLDPKAVASTLMTTSITFGKTQAPEVITGAGTLTRSGTVNAIAGWFQAELAPGIMISSAPDRPHTSWSHFKFPLDPPLVGKRGDVVEVSLKPRVVTNRRTWAWTAKVGGQVRTADAMEFVPALSRERRTKRRAQRA